MNKKGKVAKNWDKDRAQWLKKSNDGSDTWRCPIGGRLLSNNKVLLEQFPNILPITVDHGESRTRNVSRRRDLTNLGGMCNKHNTRKGSLSLEEYKAKETDLVCGNY